MKFAIQNQSKAKQSKVEREAGEERAEKPTIPPANLLYYDCVCCCGLSKLHQDSRVK